MSYHAGHITNTSFFFFYYKILFYLFIFGCARSSPLNWIFFFLSLIVVSGGHSLAMVHKPVTMVAPPVAEHRHKQPGRLGLTEVASRLWSTSSVVVVDGSSLPMTCGILPDQRWQLCLSYWQADSSPLSHQGNPKHLLLLLLSHVVAKLLSHVLLFVSPRTAECQAFLSFIISQSLVTLMSIEFGDSI